MNKSLVRYDRVRQGRRGRWIGRSRGFTLIELLVTIAIIIIILAIAVPQMQNASRAYQMRSAVASVTGALQAARYQAISNGFPYRVAMNKANTNYQVWSNPCGNTNPCWGKVGGVVPLSGSSITPTLSQDTSLDFHPSGQVQASTGTTTFTITYRGTTETIAISNYGNITVTP